MGAPVLIRDGLVAPSEYRIAPLRVVWLLREFNDPAGTFTDLSGTLAKFAREGRIASSWKPTYGTVARVTHGLLHPDAPWDSWANDTSRYAPALAQIAAVNIKKISGGSVAVWQQLKDHFEQNEPQLRSQVTGLDPRPDVVIGGNVMWLCRELCGGWIPRFPVNPDDPYEAAVHDGIIWVHANHPSKPGNRRRYFERIRDAILGARRSS